MAGPTGLCYETLPVLFKLFEVPDAEQLDVFGALQEMEVQALNTMHEK